MAETSETTSGRHVNVENDLARPQGVGPRYAGIRRTTGGKFDQGGASSRRGSPRADDRHGHVIRLTEQECPTWIDEARTCNGDRAVAPGVATRGRFTTPRIVNSVGGRRRRRVHNHGCDEQRYERLQMINRAPELLDRS